MPNEFTPSGSRTSESSAESADDSRWVTGGRAQIRPQGANRVHRKETPIKGRQKAQTTRFPEAHRGTHGLNWTLLHGAR